MTATLRPLGWEPPVADGQDIRLPGAGIELGATAWPGQGLPVVLLHGLASQRRFWNLVVRRLAGVPVLALDARGHGDSAQPDTGYDLATVADDVVSAMRAAGLQRAVVAGHSWGGAVALTVAARHPELVAGVVALDGGFAEPGRGEDPAVVRKRLEPPRFALPAAELTTRMAQGPLAPWWGPELAAAVLPIFAVDDDGIARARLPFERHMDVVDGLLALDLGALLPRVRCPAWLVSCEPVGPIAADDPAARWVQAKADGLRRAAQLLAAPRALRWSGALHDVPLQWPDLVAGLVRAARHDAEQHAPSDGPTGRGRTPQ